MPMDRARYPKNWEEIAQHVKQAADWRCQECGRPCKRPHQSWAFFKAAIAICAPYWADEFDEGTPKHHRFVLTVAHLDQNPANNDPANLRALCSVCHLRHDAPFREANRRAKLERKGQLNLLEVGNE